VIGGLSRVKRSNQRGDDDDDLNVVKSTNADSTTTEPASFLP